MDAVTTGRGNAGGVGTPRGGGRGHGMGVWGGDRGAQIGRGRGSRDRQACYKRRWGAGEVVQVPQI